MKIVLLFIALVLSGCASVGNKINHNYVATIEKGVTTEQEVLKNMGPPMASATTSEGKRVLTYIHSKTQVHGATFIPIVGLFAGGADSQSTTVVITIDTETGLVTDWTTSTANTTVKNGGA